MTDRKHRYEVILAGSGGQGLIVAGIILGEAALLEGKNVVQTASYGIASRGGLTRAEVIIDREEILFQQVQEPDVVLALTAEAVAIYAGLAGAGVPVFYDTTLCPSRTGDNLHGYPFTRLAGERGQAVNLIALGAVSAATGLVEAQSLVQVITKRFRHQAAELNLQALCSGIGLVGPGRS